MTTEAGAAAAAAAAAAEHVLIIGAGLSGLALANVLKNKGIPYKIFERDTSPEDRTQGWSLSMHFCLPKLFALLDPAKVSVFPESATVDPVHPNDSSLGMLDGTTGEPFFKFDNHSSGIAPDSGNGGSNTHHPLRYRVNRKRLRHWLMQGIDVQWNKAIDHYTVSKDGSSNVEVTFTDGTTEHGRVIVGADGVNSVVCRQWIGDDQFDRATTLSPLKVIAGSRWYESTQAKPFQTTSALCFGASEKDQVVLFASLSDRNDDGYQIQWSISCMHESLVIGDTDAERFEQAKTLMRRANFEAKLTDLVLGTPEGSQTIGLRIRERSPALVFDASRKKPGAAAVTLIGDAAHSMTMFRGEGGNHAILDACILGEYLIDAYSGKHSFSQALEMYQNEILPRTAKAVQESHDASFVMHGPREAVNQMVASIFKGQ